MSGSPRGNGSLQIDGSTRSDEPPLAGRHASSGRRGASPEGIASQRGGSRRGASSQRGGSPVASPMQRGKAPAAWAPDAGSAGQAEGDEYTGGGGSGAGPSRDCTGGGGGWAGPELDDYVADRVSEQVREGGGQERKGGGGAGARAGRGGGREVPGQGRREGVEKAHWRARLHLEICCANRQPESVPRLPVQSLNHGTSHAKHSAEKPVALTPHCGQPTPPLLNNGRGRGLPPRRDTHPNPPHLHPPVLPSPACPVSRGHPPPPRLISPPTPLSPPYSLAPGHPPPPRLVRCGRLPQRRHTTRSSMQRRLFIGAEIVARRGGPCGREHRPGGGGATGRVGPATPTGNGGAGGCGRGGKGGERGGGEAQRPVQGGECRKGRGHRGRMGRPGVMVTFLPSSFRRRKLGGRYWRR